MLTTILIMLVILVGLAILGVPIYIALLGSTVYLMFINSMSMNNVVTGLFEALTKNSLLAVPFFVFAGSIMANTSLGRRLINVFEVAWLSLVLPPMLCSAPFLVLHPLRRLLLARLFMNQSKNNMMTAHRSA